MSSGPPVVDFGPPAVPAFLTKLRLLVDDKETNDLIYWDPTGTSFHICDGNRLAKEVLPLFFKHNNLSSFIRQLNMYGFRKVNRVDPNVVFKSDADDLEFKHPFFIRQRPHLISKIQRKPPSHSYSGFPKGPMYDTGSTTFSTTDSLLNQTPADNIGQHVATVGDFLRLSGVIRNMRVTQETMAQQVALLQSENQLLFHELYDLRERHERQSQLIQSLFSFLTAFAKDGRNQNFHFGFKRKALPLALSNGQPPHTGLRLNLPQGYRLNDNFQQFKLSPTNDLKDVPYKLARVEVDSSKGHSQSATLPSTTHVSNMLTDETFSNGNMTQAIECVSASASKLPSTYANAVRKSFVNRSSSNGILASAQAPSCAPNVVETAGPLVQADLCPRWDFKSQINETDLPLASLTQPSKQSPVDDVAGHADPGNACLLGSETPLLDLNLSRCTTPISLIQPDSVDICELLGNRNESESEISFDDLFLASGALDDATDQNQGDQPDKPSALSTPRRNGRESTESDVTIGFSDDNPETTVVLDQTVPVSDVVVPVNTSDSTPFTMGNVSARLTSRPAGSRCNSLLRDSVRGSSLDLEGEVLPFGLPWEDQEVVLQTEADAESGGSNVDATRFDHFSSGLLPVQNKNLRVKRLPYTRRSSCVVPARQTGTSQGRFIVGDKFITTDSDVPFSNVHFFEPTSFVPAASVPSQLNTPTSGLSHRSSPPVIVSSRSPSQVLFPTIAPKLRSTPCLVSATPVSAINFTHSPIQLTTPIFQLQTTPVAHTVRPSPQLATSSRRKVRPTWRPIAPATLRPVTAKGRDTKTS